MLRHLSGVNSLATDADTLSNVKGHVLPVRRDVDEVSRFLTGGIRQGHFGNGRRNWTRQIRQ